MDVFREVSMSPQPTNSLTELGQEAGLALKSAGHNVAVFESTTAGLIQAALQVVPGASSYTTCGAVTYGKEHAAAALGMDLSTSSKPSDGAAYKSSKIAWTQSVAGHKRREVGATWCICESGACGPTFNYSDITAGFTAIFVTGPVERGILVQSDSNDREANMWMFAKAALDLLAACVKEAAATKAEASVETLLSTREDRYGGVEVEVTGFETSTPVRLFALELRQGLESWIAKGKKGIWLKVPLQAASCVGSAVTQGFQFHHAKQDYVLLTRWLPDTPSSLPKYSFTQIGVGGIVLNSKGEVLMVQERVSPIPQFQGSWKLPGGLADPGEDFAETVAREVQEETGVTGSLSGVVSIRHSHGFRFSQGDIYVVVKMQATTEEITLDPHELLDAQWMSAEVIESLVADPSTDSLDGKVSANNWNVISNALHGSLIEGTVIPNSRGGKPSMLYTAPKPTGAL
eukprot:TRINITY_DN74671_c0_g1_i1.p1 TRINITY_DN74671_c0_g1~~TRINITY_DN74671_c0_g1_i1.p1  ORF type:complete len:460 (+),score=64.09 TRINITY_DN74671_c0_g1_i1:66-1445(+)